MLIMIKMMAMVWFYNQDYNDADDGDDHDDGSESESPVLRTDVIWKSGGAAAGGGSVVGRDGYKSSWRS